MAGLASRGSEGIKGARPSSLTDYHGLKVYLPEEAEMSKPHRYHGPTGIIANGSITLGPRRDQRRVGIKAQLESGRGIMDT